MFQWKVAEIEKMYKLLTFIHNLKMQKNIFFYVCCFVVNNRILTRQGKGIFFSVSNNYKLFQIEESRRFRDIYVFSSKTHSQ